MTDAICLARASKPRIVLTYADRDRTFALKAVATGNVSDIARFLNLEVDHHSRGQIFVLTPAGHALFLGETP